MARISLSIKKDILQKQFKLFHSEDSTLKKSMHFLDLIIRDYTHSKRN